MQFVPRFDYGRSYLFLMMQSARVHAAIVRRVTGSTASRQRALPLQIANLRILLPTAAVMRAFEALIAPVLAYSSNNLDQLGVLGTLRDALLAKLFAGQLSVNAPTPDSHASAESKPPTAWLPSHDPAGGRSAAQDCSP
jgi:hypothetical protein